MAQRSRRSTVLVAFGVCALAVGVLLAYVTWRDTLGQDPEPASASPPSVQTERVVSRAGGFSIAAPTSMTVRKQGRTVHLASEDRALVVTVGPGESGRLPGATRRLLADLSSKYRGFERLASERIEVAGRPALSASGTFTNAAGVQIRFVAVTVRAHPANYAIVGFAAHDADPVAVLPRINAVATGFAVLDR